MGLLHCFLCLCISCVEDLLSFYCIAVISAIFMFVIVIFCFTPYIAVVLPMLLLVIVSCLLYAYLPSFEIKEIKQ